MCQQNVAESKQGEASGVTPTQANLRNQRPWAAEHHGFLAGWYLQRGEGLLGRGVCRSVPPCFPYHTLCSFPGRMNLPQMLPAPIQAWVAKAQSLRAVCRDPLAIIYLIYEHEPVAGLRPDLQC